MSCSVFFLPQTLSLLLSGEVEMNSGMLLKSLLSYLFQLQIPLSQFFPLFPLFPPKFDSDPGATTGAGPASQQILTLGWHGPGGGASACAIRLAAGSVSRSLW